jgi:hypothetical protein
LSGLGKVFPESFLQYLLHSVQRHVRQHGGSYPSNNRAKLPFEFSTSIEREGLKVRYGDGFGGAPLRVSGATRRVTTGAETSSDEQIQESSSTPVRGDHDV